MWLLAPTCSLPLTWLGHRPGLGAEKGKGKEGITVSSPVPPRLGGEDKGVTAKWGGNWNSQAKESISDVLQSKSVAPQARQSLCNLLHILPWKSATMPWRMRGQWGSIPHPILYEADHSVSIYSVRTLGHHFVTEGSRVTFRVRPQ